MLKVLALIFIFSVPAWSVETYRDLITKAQNLSLQKDRLQATKILSRATLKEKGPNRKELILALKELAEIFYSDKGQQTFELGRSLDDSAPSNAVDRYNEALALEPGNTSILKALSRAYASLILCDKGLESANQGLAINPFDDELILLKAQNAVCLKKTEYSKLVSDLSDLMKTNLKIHADFLKAKALFVEGKLPAAEAQIDKTLTADPKFPESHYYLGLLKLKNGKDATEHFQKYVSLCSDLNAEKKRKYRAEPRLCAEKTKAEAEIEKTRTVQAREARVSFAFDHTHS
jgi:tetratricopeptide (TPR) repeat protein